MFSHGFNKYVLEEAIGTGSHGEVWRAFDKTLERQVAIKILETADEKEAERCLKEARHLAKIRHPNIVSIYECFQHEGKTYLVMDYLEGQPLGPYMDSHEFTESEATAFAIQLVDALSTVHAAHIVHADIKPSNIMVTGGGTPVLIDFGISNNIARQHDLDTLTLGSGVPESIKGTIPYMAPEVINGERPTEKSDIFSFGALFFELLTGQRAFDEPTDIATLNAVVNRKPNAPPDIRHSIPASLNRLLNRMLAKQAEKRPVSMTEIQAELEEFGGEAGASNSGIRVSVKAIAAMAASVMLLISLGLYAYWGQLWPRGSELSVQQTISAGLESLKNYQKKGALDEAIGHFQSVLVKDPENAAATAGLSLAYVRQYKTSEANPAILEQARSAAEIATELDAHLALAHTAMAWVHEYSGMDEDAEEHYRQALQLDPDGYFTLEGYARWLTRLKRYDEAAAIYNQAILAYSNYSQFFDDFGRLLYERQKFDAAKDVFQKSILLSPDNVFAYASLSAVQYAQNDISGAIRTIQKGLQVKPHPALYNNLGTYFFAQEQYAQAVNAFERKIEMQGASEDYLSWANLADSYRWTFDLKDRAPAAYRMALKIIYKRFPQSTPRPDIQSRAALYHAKARQIDEAKFALGEALKLAPEDASILFRAAVTSELIGDRTTALSHLKAALKNGYPLNIVQQDPELQALRRDNEYLQFLLEHTFGDGDNNG